MNEAYDESGQREFGDVGTYIEDVNRMITNITYSGSIFAAAGPRCPRNDGGCGGQVVRLETIWLTHSDRGKPLNDLGRVSAPPRKPRFHQKEPSPPHRPIPTQGPWRHTGPSAAPATDLAALQRKIRSSTVKAVLVAGVASLLISVCLSDLFSPDTFHLGFLAPPLIVVAVVLAVGVANYRTAPQRHRKEQDSLRRRAHDQQAAQAEQQRQMLESQTKSYNERVVLYEQELSDYKSSEHRYQKMLRRFERLHRIWADSWSCTQCGQRWRAEKINREDFTEL